MTCSFGVPMSYGWIKKVISFKRRKFRRLKVINCVVNCIDSDKEYQAEVIDLSERGMKIDIEEPLVLYLKVNLFMTCEDGKELEKKAEVVWFIKKTYPEKGIYTGLRFI